MTRKPIQAPMVMKFGDVEVPVTNVHMRTLGTDQASYSQLKGEVVGRPPAELRSADFEVFRDEICARVSVNPEQFEAFTNQLQRDYERGVLRNDVQAAVCGVVAASLRYFHWWCEQEKR